MRTTTCMIDSHVEGCRKLTMSRHVWTARRPMQWILFQPHRRNIVRPHGIAKAQRFMVSTSLLRESLNWHTERLAITQAKSQFKEELFVWFLPISDDLIPFYRIFFDSLGIARRSLQFAVQAEKAIKPTGDRISRSRNGKKAALGWFGVYICQLFVSRYHRRDTEDLVWF